MELVKPIKDVNKIKEIKEELKKNGTRDLLLFTFGLNTGLRISDIVILKKKDVMTGIVAIKEEKTDKRKEFPLNQAILDILTPFIANMAEEDYIFQSRQVDKDGKAKHITRQQAYNILNRACANCGVKEGIGCHTLRKSFGYHHYKKFQDVALLQKIFNHSAPSITLRYIGIDQEEINNSYMSFSL